MEDDSSPDEKTDKSKSITLPDITNSATPRREKIGTSITKIDASLSNNLSYENLQTHTAVPTYDSKTADRKSNRRKDRYNSKSTLIGSKKSISLSNK